MIIAIWRTFFNKNKNSKINVSFYNIMNYQKIHPEIIDNPNNILNLDKYNGRVDIIQPPDPNAVFKMQQRNASNNKSTTQYDSIDDTWEDNSVSKV